MKPEKIQKEFDINDIEAGGVPPIEGKRSIVSIDFDEPMDIPEQVFKGIRRLKSTEWYKNLTENGLKAVPLPLKGSSKLALLIGTTALVGSAYLGYRHYKERKKK